MAQPTKPSPVQALFVPSCGTRLVWRKYSPEHAIVVQYHCATAWADGDRFERPLTKHELDSMINNDSNWELEIEVDGRGIEDMAFACPAGKCPFALDLGFKRVEVFEAKATLQDVLMRIGAGMCCGVLCMRATSQAGATLRVRVVALHEFCTGAHHVPSKHGSFDAC